MPPNDILKQWQDARANRKMQFKVGDYHSIRMLTGTIKADWIQLPVERNKAASPWACTRAEKLQVSVFLPDDSSLDEWYAGVCALSTVWPDVSMLGACYLRKVVGYDFHRIRRKYEVASMWGNISPQWRLLQQNLEAKGPGWALPPEREARLLTNRSNRPGDDMKDDLRTDDDPAAWRTWRNSQQLLRRQRRPGPPLEFPGDSDMVEALYAQAREEVQGISLQFTIGSQDTPRSGKKKRKQLDDVATMQLTQHNAEDCGCI